ncbi:MAG: cyclase [Chloroflexi bacterium HGW-Chloroflexi-10]|nr:MAG: cyclase [Chloroflexi bacterium HGW-Chloroflexi-10]
MKIIDISLGIDAQLPTWPGDPAIEMYRENKIEEGANANVSRINMGVHTGTHVDAPFHFLQDGYSVEKLSLDTLIGKVWVVSIPDEVVEINRVVLSGINLSKHPGRILFKTKNSQFWQEKPLKFHTEFVGISKDGAEYLVEIGVKFVGIDYLSISPYKKSKPTHEVLLHAEMVVLEGVDLYHVEPGEYQLFCLPLKLVGSDGAPARTVLVQY